MLATVNYLSATNKLQRACEATLGSVAFARERRLTLSMSLAQEIDKQADKAIVCAGWNGRVKCAFFLGEELRRETTDLFSQLREQNLTLAILTGDHHDRAAAVSQLTGVAAIGQLLPDEKLRELRKLPQPVAMVGDGINDSIAMAVADVGISLDCGADVSRDASDVCLLGNTLKNLPWAISLAKSAQKTVTRNLVWAVTYNAVGIGFAVAGKLNPIVAAIAMVGSSLFVLSNSLSFAAQPLGQQPNRELDKRLRNDIPVRSVTAAESINEQNNSDIDPLRRAAESAVQLATGSPK
jgi:P-type E1-E2 ATPase